MVRVAIIPQVHLRVLMPQTRNLTRKVNYTACQNNDDDCQMTNQNILKWATWPATLCTESRVILSEPKRGIRESMQPCTRLFVWQSQNPGAGNVVRRGCMGDNRASQIICAIMTIRHFRTNQMNSKWHSSYTIKCRTSIMLLDCQSKPSLSYTSAKIPPTILDLH